MKFGRQDFLPFSFFLNIIFLWQLIHIKPIQSIRNRMVDPFTRGKISQGYLCFSRSLMITPTSSILILSCFIESRSLIVTVLSSSVW